MPTLTSRDAGSAVGDGQSLLEATHSDGRPFPEVSATARLSGKTAITVRVERPE